MPASGASVRAHAALTANEPKPAPPKMTRQRKLGFELREAAISGQLREVARLVKEGADTEVADYSGYTAISEAAVSGNTMICGELLRALADPNNPAQDGRTALHRAALHSWTPVVRLMLDHGADPRLKDEDGKTPADLARNLATRELLEAFPAEQTDELLEERRQKLASRPAPSEELLMEVPEVSEKDVAEGTTAKEEEEKPIPVVTFQPPPREPVKKEESLSVEAKKAERERKYQEAMAEIQATFPSAEEGQAEDGASKFEGPLPLTARVEVLGAGEERLNGTYHVRFVYKDRIEFSKLSDEQCQVYWTQHQDEWRMLIGDFKMGSTLYRHKYRPNWKADECHGVPQQDWQKWFGKGPEPTVRYLTEDEPEQPAKPEAERAVRYVITEEADDTDEAPQARTSPSGQQAEFIELHSKLEIVHSDDGARRRGIGSPQGASAKKVEVSLGGAGLVETADGLFSPEEVQQQTQRSTETDAEVEAAAWLESLGDMPEAEPIWEEIQEVKSAAQELYVEGKLGEARKATTAALRALRRLQQKSVLVAEIEVGSEDSSQKTKKDGYTATPEEFEALAGVLHSNRSLLLTLQIEAEDTEALPFGSAAAWRLVVNDADAALQTNANNFKASYRRARALFELGELDEALADATRVVDHYARQSVTPNPEAAALREKILEAIRIERRKWGEKSTARWNRGGAHQALVVEVDAPMNESSGNSQASTKPKLSGDQTLSVPWEASTAQKPRSPQAVAQKLAAAPARPIAAPKNGGDVEKALLSILKDDPSRQLDYVREHLSKASLRKLYRRAPLGPDMLAVLIRLLVDLAQEDKVQAAELLGALAAAPSAKTHVAMFNTEEQSALQKLLGLVGPDAAAEWAPETAADGGA